VAAPYRVLAIDGGGIRGIIPATVLADLERRLAPHSVATSFDLIVGTSTGGILALGLTAPDGERPRHPAERLRELYETEAQTIFPGGGPASLTERVFGEPSSRAWYRDPLHMLLRKSAREKEAGGARYFATGLEEVLRRYLGDAPLTSAVAEVVVTSYDLAYGEPLLFSSRPREGFVSDVPMVVAARATSAGPTFFKPQLLRDGDRERVLVDGGVYVNNPAVLGYLLGGEAAVRDERPLVLVSLGTGRRPPRSPLTAAEAQLVDSFGTARTLMEAVATGSGSMGDALLAGLADGERFRYWRLQTTVGSCSFTMDDSTSENVACLGERGRELVAESDEELAAIVQAVAAWNDVQSSR
jgi:patatin-like phospholipase/acyl hydrolase